MSATQAVARRLRRGRDVTVIVHETGPRDDSRVALDVVRALAQEPEWRLRVVAQVRGGMHDAFVTAAPTAYFTDWRGPRVLRGLLRVLRRLPAGARLAGWLHDLDVRIRLGRVTRGDVVLAIGADLARFLRFVPNGHRIVWYVLQQPWYFDTAEAGDVAHVLNAVGRLLAGTPKLAAELVAAGAVESRVSVLAPSVSPLPSPPLDRELPAAFYLSWGPLGWASGTDLFLTVTAALRRRGVAARGLWFADDSPGWQQDRFDHDAARIDPGHRRATRRERSQLANHLVPGSVAIVPTRGDIPVVTVQEVAMAGVAVVCFRGSDFDTAYGDAVVAVPPLDTAAMADAAARLLADRELAGQMGVRLRSVARANRNPSEFARTLVHTLAADSSV